MKIKKIVFVVFLAISIPLTSQANDKSDINPYVIESTDEIYILDSNWMYITHDDISNIDKDYHSSDWNPLNMQGPWQMRISEESENGICWLKLPFTIKKGVKFKKLGLRIPVVYGAIQVYLNETVIYASSPFNLNNKKSMTGNKPVVIELPLHLLDDNVNYLTLRVSSYSGWSAFPGWLKMGSYEKINDSWIRFLIKNIAIGFISLFLFFFFIIHYILRKKELYNLLFSGMCFSVGLFVIGLEGLWYYLLNYPWAYWVLTFIGGVNMYLMPILFIHSFFNLKLKITSKTFIIFYSVLNIIIFVEYMLTGQILYFIKYLYFLFNLSYIPLVIYLFTITIKAVKNKLKYSRLMLLGVLILGVFFIYSMFCFMGMIKKAPLIGEGFFLMAVVFSIILAKRFAQTHTDLEATHKKNLELNRTLEEKVRDRTAELENKNREIMESIEYAGLIQNSMLPEQGKLEDVFSDHFVIWQPRDIVGGDFYWHHKNGDDFLIALMDCTGHGVPGSLLTMTATSVLGRVVHHINNNDPAEILRELNRIMKKMLSQGHQIDLSDDGLEIGLCHYSAEEKQLTYAGSRIRLHILRNGELTEIRGDRQGIGHKRGKINFRYTNHTVPVTGDSTFYMTTDGYLDQGGGTKGFSYGWTRYKKSLTRYGHMAMEEQRNMLEQTLKEFQGQEDQRDDISLIGFKVALS